MTAITVRTADAEGTRSVAAAAASMLAAGDVLALSGELGAGKTCFVQGAARALGVTLPVTSPTFVLMRTYPAEQALVLVHLDVYRLGRLQDVLDLGEEVFAPDVVTMVEWADAITGLLPGDRLDIEITHAVPDDLDDERRAITFTPQGAWLERADALRAALVPHLHEVA